MVLARFCLPTSFSAPLMLRVLSGAIGVIPQAQWRLASQWGLSDLERLEDRMASAQTGHTRLLALVFLLCFTSFSLVLMLGGGPAVTTLEVSIYTACGSISTCQWPSWLCCN